MAVGMILDVRCVEGRVGAGEHAELAKMRAKGLEPLNDRWKARYKEPAAPDTSKLPELPEGWVWASISQLTSHLIPTAIASDSRGIPKSVEF